MVTQLKCLNDIQISKKIMQKEFVVQVACFVRNAIIQVLKFLFKERR